MILATIQHGQRNTTKTSASFSPAGDYAIEHATVAQKTERPVVGRPEECVVRPTEGGGADNPAFAAFFMDDVISVKV